MPERMPVAGRDAFLQARRERRPVVIGIPFDLQARPWEGKTDLPKPSRELLPRPSPIPAHPDDVAAAAKLIAGAVPPEGGLECVKEADLVVAVGCSLAYRAGGGGQLWPKAKMLQIDIDPVAVSQGQEVARHHLRADARPGVAALIAALPARQASWRTEAVAARIRDSRPDSHVFD